MSIRLEIPESYESKLSPRETEKAIGLIKNYFQTALAYELNLVRVTAPLFVQAGTGINDDLNGIEKPVSFDIKEVDGMTVEIVQSLAKWKRMTLGDLDFAEGEGLYTDMNALRPDETLSNIHSVYVDQWDWERVMAPDERNVEFLKMIVQRIYDVIRRTALYICHEYDALEPFLPDEIEIMHSEDMEQRWPDLDPRERENQAVKEYGAIFVIGIGGALVNGEFHDGRAPDYDDWSTPVDDRHRGLNGDIIVYNPLFDRAMELSSMGIRVDPESLVRQLEIRDLNKRKELMFHQRLLNGELPQTIGGGIGQSRLCMLYLQKAHIGEIQASVWPEEMKTRCRENGIFLL